MVKTIQLGSRTIGEGSPCFIIAEGGVNHNGHVEMARKLIEKAAQLGADAIKFQKRTVDDILIQEALEKPYQSPTALAPTYGEHRRKLELSEDVYRELFAYARQLNIVFLASAWDAKSADFLNTLGIELFKMASADLTNLPLLDHVARFKKPMALSTGMSTLEEIDEAVHTITKHHSDLVLLHCVSAYPCENTDVNLRVIETLRSRYKLPIGYSGHERGVAIPIAAAARGACVIEKHFTLDRTLPGPDHAASLEPQGMERLIHYIRTIESALGDGEKRFLDCEKPLRARLAKSVVARCDIPSGTTITADMLTVKGPGVGLKPSLSPKLVGKKASRKIDKDTLIPHEAMEW